MESRFLQPSLLIILLKILLSASLKIFFNRARVRSCPPYGWDGGPRGGTQDFKWWRCSKDFFGFEIFNSGIFLGTKIWQVFFLGSLVWVGICWGIISYRYSNFGQRTNVLLPSVTLQQQKRWVLFFSYCLLPGSSCTIIVFINIPSVNTQKWYWNIRCGRSLYGCIIVYGSMIITFNICN